MPSASLYRGETQIDTARLAVPTGTPRVRCHFNMPVDRNSETSDIVLADE
jgi:hypothetical protein